MKVLTNNQYYSEIANVIREQNGTNNTYKPPQMVSALKDLFYEEVEGVPPISFNGIGENLLNYGIYGASGGVGERTKNFLQNTATTQTKNGVTFTVNEDKSISCNGTATGNAFFKIGDIQLEENCIMSGCPAGGDNNSYLMRLYNNGSVFKTDSGNGVLINSEVQDGYAEIRIAEGYTCNNLTFYPMIRPASIEDTSYEQYGYKVPVVINGKNLFNKNNILRNVVQDSGVYKTAVGTILLIIDVSNIDTVSFQTGVRTQRCRSAFSVEYPAVGVSYTINGVNTFQNNDNYAGKITRDVPSGAKYLGVQIYRNSGNYTEEEINNAINSFIACMGDNIGDYEPYVEPTTTNIYLEEPICNVNNNIDYIDFSSQSIMKKTGTIEFANSSNWQLEGEHNFYYDMVIETASPKSLVVSNKVPSLVTSMAETIANQYTENVWISAGQRVNLWLADIDHTLTALQNWLSQESLIVQYQLQNHSEISVNLPTIPTIKGTNVLTVDTTVQPSNVYVKSRKESQYETAMREDYEEQLSDIESALEEV